MANFTHHQDYISDFAYNPERNSVVVSSADGSLSMICLKKRDLLYQTSTCMDELLSCCVIKNGNCVCAGTQEGNVNVYKWDEEDQLMDRITGHPESIDGMLKVDEDTICTGSEDGILRIVQVMPNQFLGVAGMFEEFPVERMEWSFDRAFLAASSHDNVLRLFDMAILNEDDDEDDKEGEDDKEKEKEKEKKKEEFRGWEPIGYFYIIYNYFLRIIYFLSFLNFCCINVGSLHVTMEYSIEVHNWRNKWDICFGIGTSLIFNVFIDTLLQWEK